MLSKDRFTIQSLVDLAGHYIYPDNKDDPEYTELSSNQMDESMKRFAIKCAAMAFGGYVGIGGAFYQYSRFGIETTTIEAKFPFLDAKSHEEFLANLIFELVVFVNATFLYFGIEVMVEIFTNVVTFVPKLAHFKLNRLIEQYEKGHLTEYQAVAIFQQIEHVCVETEL